MVLSMLVGRFWNLGLMNVRMLFIQLGVNISYPWCVPFHSKYALNGRRSLVVTLLEVVMLCFICSPSPDSITTSCKFDNDEGHGCLKYRNLGEQSQVVQKLLVALLSWRKWFMRHETTCHRLHQRSHHVEMQRHALWDSPKWQHPPYRIELCNIPLSWQDENQWLQRFCFGRGLWMKSGHVYSCLCLPGRQSAALHLWVVEVSGEDDSFPWLALFDFYRESFRWANGYVCRRKKYYYRSCLWAWTILLLVGGQKRDWNSQQNKNYTLSSHLCDRQSLCEAGTLPSLSIMMGSFRFSLFISTNECSGFIHTVHKI